MPQALAFTLNSSSTKRTSTWRNLVPDQLRFVKKECYQSGLTKYVCEKMSLFYYHAASRCLRLGEACNWGIVQALHQGFCHRMPHRSLPRHLRPLWNMERYFQRCIFSEVVWSTDYSVVYNWIHHIGGREKAPAAFCRKALTSTDKFEMWGDGLQTRSITFIDECVERVLR